MANNISLINGEAHSWSQIDVILLGRVVEGISAITYESSQEKVNNFGRGVKAVSRGRGKKNHTASITLSEAEIVAIEKALPVGKDLSDIAAFPIVVTFNNNGTHTVHKLMSCEFMNRGVDVNTDSTNVERQLDLIVGDINYKAI